MPVRFILSDGFRKSEDWLGNNAAFTCPVNGCGQVYLVSAHLNRHGRECPVSPFQGVRVQLIEERGVGKNRLVNFGSNGSRAPVFELVTTR